jgi:RNA polymerase sigma-70 factor, ECF subfamily
VVDAFLAATETGDIASLLELLDPAVTFRSDGGGLVSAARQIFTGAERVARIFTRVAHHFGEQFTLSPILVNGAPGLLLETGGAPSVIAFTLDRGRITALDVVRNPEKLRTLPDAR